ncbi:hypothetical protein J8655_01010 [Dickeya oryzae]|uniref:hypothetical protein n=1 Tax=Dickeya oryzae TaxID=1240404 RepID=UPI001AECC0B9|nr:hypothetical protein [Dickeya oryzae]MBP2844085.1 hypothetical protein [Dickeya oryzae]
MFALLIIPLLISGQIIVSSPYNISYFYRLHRYDGQLLYMKSATFGSISLLLSIGGAYAIKWAFPSLTVATWLSNVLDVSSDKRENRLIAWLILLSVTTVAVAWVWTQISKLRINLIAWAVRRSFNEPEPHGFYVQAVRLSAIQEILSNGSLGQMFFDSATKDKQVLVSLKSRKVYVGTVNMISEPNEKQGPSLEISISPLMSGYREKDNLRVFFSNDYEGLDDQDTSIIFPLSEVSHASWFDMGIHEKVDNNRQQKPESNRRIRKSARKMKRPA